MMKHSPRRAAVLAVLLVPILILFGEALVGRTALWGWDWNNMFHPYVNAFAQRWGQGHLALWASELGTGYPLFAEGQSLQLYPPMNLLLRLLPSWWACGVLVAAHYLVAAVGTYAFCRRRGLGSAAAVLGALTFTLSATLTWRSIHPTVIVTVSLMPALLCALDEALRTRRAWRVAIAALVLALQLLGGHHQFTFYSLLLAVGYALVLAPRPRREEGVGTEPAQPARFSWLGRFGQGGVFLAVILLAVAICALPLAATYEMRSLTLRQTLPQEPFVTSLAFPIENLLLFIAPHLLGTVGQYMGRSVSWESCGYSTILPLLAIVGALAARPRNRDLWFWIGVVLASLALAITDGNPLYQILPHIPVFNWFRAPTRYLVVTTFALAMLLAHSFSILASLHTLAARETGEQAEVGHSAVGRAGRRATQVLGAALGLGLGLAVMASLVFCGGQSVLWSGLGANAASFYHPIRTRLDLIFNSLAGWDGVFLFLHLILGGGTLLLLLKQRVAPRLAGAVLGLLICADLLRVAQTMKERIDPAYFTHTSATTAFIQRQPGLFRVWTGESNLDAARQDPALSKLPAAFVEKSFLRPNQNVYSRLPHADSVVGLELLRSFNLMRSLGLPYGGAFLSGADEVSKKPLLLRGADAALRARLMRLLNIRYAVSTARFEVEGWRQVFPTGPDASREGGVRVWENRDVLPRAFLVGAVQFAAPQAALSALLDDSFDPAHAVILEDQDKAAATLPSAPPPDFSGTARMLSYEDTRMTLETECAQPSLLVISDTWFPGWRAWVDGVETPLLRADYTLRGIALAPGRHQIVCEYRPRWWWPALAISLLALALTTALMTPALRRAARLRTSRAGAKAHGASGQS